VIASVQYEKWWERRQKRSGQSFYGCDDVAGVTYVRGNVAMHQPKVRTARLPTNPNHAPRCLFRFSVNSHIDLAIWNDVYWMDDEDIAAASAV
jgi:hypothetical protein